jgi:predicted metal-dependent phosphoesterase TrpH
MSNYCDLHVHSNFSDGTCTPAELMALAEAAGLSAVALCDHNTVSGLPDFLAVAQGSAVEAVPGIEFSTDYRGTELHILGLFIRPEHYAPIMEMMADFHRRKEQSNIDLVENLNRAGYAIDYAAIKASTADGFVNRAVIAAALLEKGYVESIQGAFKTLLKPSHGYYNPPKRPDAFEVIRYIRSIGAAAVLAHPFLNLEEGELREFLPQAKAAGLHGMEVLYSKFDAATTALAEAMAEEFSLLKSGGSDFHGTNKPDIAVGIGRGDLRIPAEWLKNLKMVVENFEKQVDICGNI